MPTKGQANASAARGKSPSSQEAPLACTVPPLALLQFGEELYTALQRQPQHASAKLPLTRYADYLHHFGFSMEREMRQRQAPSMGGRAPTHTARAPGDDATAALGSGGFSTVATCADWGISEDLKRDADARCESVGALPGVADASAIAAQLSAPYGSVTWRQTATQCALKKARCVYAWLCGHMTLQLNPLEDAAAEADSAAVSAAGAAKAQRSAPPSKKANRPAKKEKEAPAAQEPAGPVDPLAQALEARRGTPFLLAQLYEAMLRAVGVRCDVVAGQLKGIAPGESVEWAWNTVNVEGRSYLVDVAAALSNGVLRSAPPPAAAAEPVKAAAASAGGEQRRPSAGDGGGSGGWGVPRLLSTVDAAVRRDFFFFTHPTSFLASHLPSTAAQSLATAPPKAVHWVAQPYVTPALFVHGLRLLSHPSHATIAVGSTPAHISVSHANPGATELCCVLFPGTLQGFAETIGSNASLGPEWVWHQREDATDAETFTLTVPQAGYYVAVIGVRAIRPDPYGAAMVTASAAAFAPVVLYEVRVGFTPSGSPVLPRQYLSPSICRLMTPLCAQVLPGTQKFCVMPSCSNVLSVAVVRVSAAPLPADAAASAPAAPPPVRRTLLSFLGFEARRAAFEGFAEVKAGDVVELWVLYGAPDLNGQQLAQRVGAAKLRVVEAAAPALEPRSADKKKKKATTPEDQQADDLQHSRLEHALRRGEAFVLFVGGLEVKHFVSPAVVSVIMPQPSVEQEHASTLRRLAGVTEALMGEANFTAQHQATPVGSYFGAVATTTR